VTKKKYHDPELSLQTADHAARKGDGCGIQIFPFMVTCPASSGHPPDGPGFDHQIYVSVFVENNRRKLW
jgi:hypothetical protein